MKPAILALLGVALAAGVCTTAAAGAEKVGTFRGEHVEFAVKYYAGGVGYSPREEEAARSSEYSLRVLFAAPDRALLANVGLIVTDPAGRVVFRIEGADPVIYLSLPKGTYGFEGRYRGSSQHHGGVVVDPDRRRDILFVMPE